MKLALRISVKDYRTTNNSATSSLTQPSPQGEDFHVRRLFERSVAGLAGWSADKTENVRRLFPLLGGEGQGEGERQSNFFLCPPLSGGCIGLV
jgi:hypothetical protein